MQELEVRIVRLDPMYVLSTHGFGASPEAQAWERIRDWIKRNGLDGELGDHRFFGFNNPDPTPGSPNYGYEQWMTLAEGYQPRDASDGEVKRFGGGRYAVTRCRLPEIGESWRRLVVWVEAQGHATGRQQWLEELLTAIDLPPEEVVMDIYYPLADQD